MKNFKFDFRQTKYGLPLILLPFLLLGVYVISTMFPPKDERSIAERTSLEGINTSLPDPALSEQKDKFQLLQELLERRKQQSGIESVEELREFLSQDLFDNDIDLLENFLNPVTDSLLFANEQQTADDAVAALEALHKKFFPDDPDIFGLQGFNVPSPPQPRNGQEEEIRLMREQIARMDSALRARAETTNTNQIQEIETDILTAKKADFQQSNAFNTLKANKKEMFIAAMLDEAQTVVAGSRIRIRLMDDIFIGDHLFRKGTYLYGLVSGFSAQRVKVNITTVLYGERILKLNLSIYDNDGIQGLYVPSSDFREMMRVAGSRMAQSGNVNINANQNPYQQLMAQMGQDFYRSVTSAVSSRIKQNKAKLKYASLIYLVNEDNRNNDDNYNFFN